jgi:hypothetical protein
MITISLHLVRTQPRIHFDVYIGFVESLEDRCSQFISCVLWPKIDARNIFQAPLIRVQSSGIKQNESTIRDGRLIHLGTLRTWTASAVYYMLWDLGGELHLCRLRCESKAEESWRYVRMTTTSFHRRKWGRKHVVICNWMQLELVLQNWTTDGYSVVGHSTSESFSTWVLADDAGWDASLSAMNSFR